MKKVGLRFLDYVQMDTRSNMPKPGEESPKPSSKGQLELAEKLHQELRELGVEDHQFSDFSDGSFIVHFPATEGFKKSPHVVFAAHMDTYYGFNGKANPIIHDYLSGDIRLPNNDVVIPEADLSGLGGKKIITSDGTSLLGADDKAGVAALVTTIEWVIFSNYNHGDLTFWFCVDEEIGALDIKVIPEEMVKSWDILWTVDGERLGPIDIGCLVCRMVPVTFKGVDAHPGVQGDKLKPAHYAAAALVFNMASLPTPMNTSGMESFYYAANIEGTPSKATVLCAPRSFDREESEKMLAHLKDMAEVCANKYGCTYELEDRLVCINTRDAIEKHSGLLEPGKIAHESTGYKPVLENVRGGTDGAMVNMAYPDLPAPNMGTGAKNLHGPQEFLVVEELEECVQAMMMMVDLYVKMD